MHALEALTSLDGRYRRKVEPLANIFSEFGLIRSRVLVESEYFLALANHEDVPFSLKPEEKHLVQDLAHNFRLEDAQDIKTLETKGLWNIPATNHDVKAVEIWMRKKLESTSLGDTIEWIHFGLTSEDVNNIAYALMLSDGVGNLLMPELDKIALFLFQLGERYASLPMLSRTHGQPATPTTFGKEMNVFANRLARQYQMLSEFFILAKLNGASGNYCAHAAALPNVNWTTFSEKFIAHFNTPERRIKLEPNLVTTQIEPHDTYCELFDILRRTNSILIDLCQDMWRYISDDWVVLKPVAGEVGSSTMPHKVNPIDWENAEGAMGKANALLEFFSRKLPISRLQRDLSDSTVERDFGTALGWCLQAYLFIQQGAGKIHPNIGAITDTLNAHPEVITEAIQTILRREGVDAAYDKLKELSRGRKLTLEDLRGFINSLDIPTETKAELLQLGPTNYIGEAVDLATLNN